jgi:pyruvate dehydrogenase E1 component alpha subunit
LKHVLRLLYLSRTFQEKLHQLGGKCIRDNGEEGIMIGTLLGLRDDDLISCYFRSEGPQLLMRGSVNLRDLMAWWLWKVGENGLVTTVMPSAWTDVERGIIGTTSTLIGSDTSVCCGAAIVQKMKKSGKAVLLMVGDGATSKGDFYEVLNFAALYKLPMVFLVRNNNWAMSTTMAGTIAVKSFEDLAKPFGIPARTVEGNDAVELADAVKEAADYARSGKGPACIVAKTYRMAPHTVDDFDEYREGDPEKIKWAKRDPILMAEQKLLSQGVSQKEIDDIKAKVDKEVEDAADWAVKRPDMKPEDYLKIQQSVTDRMWGGARK